jgi:putative Holliday junction resolvase
MKYLALDMGERKVGLAGSDSGIAAVPMPALEMGPEFMHDLGVVIDAEKPEIIIFGVPHHINGDETAFGDDVRKLAEGVKHEFGIEIDFEDEFGTTKDAETRLREMGVAERDLGKYDDSVAAAIILENYFSRNIKH